MWTDSYFRNMHSFCNLRGEASCFFFLWFVWWLHGNVKLSMMTTNNIILHGLSLYRLFMSRMTFRWQNITLLIFWSFFARVFFQVLAWNVSFYNCYNVGSFFTVDDQQNYYNEMLTQPFICVVRFRCILSLFSDLECQSFYLHIKPY